MGPRKCVPSRIESRDSTPRVPPSGFGPQKICSPILPPGMGSRKCAPQEWGAEIPPPGLGSQKVCSPRMGSRGSTFRNGLQKICSPKNGKQRFYLQEWVPENVLPQEWGAEVLPPRIGSKKCALPIMGSRGSTSRNWPQKICSPRMGSIGSTTMDEPQKPYSPVGIMFPQEHGARIRLSKNGEHKWRMAEVMVPDSP